MKMADAERYISERLQQVYEKSEAKNIAGLLIEHITTLSKNERLSRNDYELTTEHELAFRDNIQRLLNHEPIQYIMNKSWFYGMELYVDHSVLIPRPETEELVEWIINDIKASGLEVFTREMAGADKTNLLKVLDVGTGSGCIALALKKTMPAAEVWGCDVSEVALNVARRNGSALDIRVDFQGLNFLDPEQQRQLPTVNILVSNPPYIPTKDKQLMDRNVVEHEPHLALFVPDDDPLVFYRALVKFGMHRLYQNGTIYMEIHEDLGSHVTDMFTEEGYSSVELKKDMQGKNRMVKVKK